MAGEDVKPTLNYGAPAGGYYANGGDGGGAAAAPAVKPEPLGPNTAIQLVVKDQTGGEVHFKVKRHTKFSKIFDAYCSKKNVQPNSYRFVFDGTRLNPESMPSEHDMEDDDTIEAFVEQVGGRR